MGISPRKGFEGRLTVIGIAQFKRDIGKESQCEGGESDFDPCCKRRKLKMLLR